MYLVHNDPRGELAVGTGGDGVVFAARGVAVEVPDHVAGERPSAWARHVAGDGTALRPQFDDGRAWMQDDDGVWLVRNLGSGLLAFEQYLDGDVEFIWRSATDDEVAAAHGGEG